jgi:hypothetical protein
VTSFAGLVRAIAARTVAASARALSVVATRRTVRWHLCQEWPPHEMERGQSPPLDPDGREARPTDLQTQWEGLLDLVWKLEAWERLGQHQVDGLKD